MPLLPGCQGSYFGYPFPLVSDFAIPYSEIRNRFPSSFFLGDRAIVAFIAFSLLWSYIFRRHFIIRGHFIIEKTYIQKTVNNLFIFEALFQCLNSFFRNQYSYTCLQYYCCFEPSSIERFFSASSRLFFSLSEALLLCFFFETLSMP